MILLAHRGDTNNFQENTMEAIESALAKGAHGVEIDVQVENSEAVLVHNYVHRTSPEYPHLEEVLTLFGDRGRLEIEIKSFRLDEIKLITDLIKTNPPAEFSVTSSVHPALIHIRKLLPNAQIGSIFPGKLFEEWMPNSFIARLMDGYMELTGADVVHLPPSHYNQEIIEYLRGQGRVLHGHINTADEEEYRRLADMGIDQATFDDIELLEYV